MSKPVRVRRFIALAAAYLVALQVLLLPLTVAAFAAPDTGLCLSGGSESTHQQSGHDTGCACAAGCGMPCGASVLASPPAQAAVVPPPVRSFAVVLRTTEADTARPADRGPHSPRAPPSA